VTKSRLVPRFGSPPEWLRIGSKDENKWVLYWRQNNDKDGWHSLVLRHNNRRFRKEAYWCGWNGQRLSNTSDMAILAEHFPAVYDWLQALCGNMWRNEDADRTENQEGADRRLRQSR
jgi:hypothetical protein